jgi:predicted nuclease with TOPRIM domain
MARPQVDSETVDRLDDLADDLLRVRPEAVAFDERLRAVLDDYVELRDQVEELKAQQSRADSVGSIGGQFQ